jgi:D-galactarolactone cycloisomerase
MRIGAMDGSVDAASRRVRAARAALGPDVALMVDAHGTLNVAEAQALLRGAAELGLRFVEEPVASDDRAGLAEVRARARCRSRRARASSPLLRLRRAASRPRARRAAAGPRDRGRLSEGLRIGALAYAHRLELAPHCWGSAISFQAARTLAFACPAGTCWSRCRWAARRCCARWRRSTSRCTTARCCRRRASGFGVEPDPDFVRRHTRG